MKLIPKHEKGYSIVYYPNEFSISDGLNKKLHKELSKYKPENAKSIQDIYSQVLNHGWSSGVAAAFVGNSLHEGYLDPYTVLKGGPAAGMYLFEKQTNDDYQNWKKTSDLAIKKNPLHNLTAFVLDKMNLGRSGTNPAIGFFYPKGDPDREKIFNNYNIKNTQDIYHALDHSQDNYSKATDLFLIGFERPKDLKTRDKRKKAAGLVHKELYNLYMKLQGLKQKQAIGNDPVIIQPVDPKKNPIVIKPYKKTVAVKK